jgi:hypothetical protein
LGHPEAVVLFFEKALKALYKIFPFQIAMIGVEMDGLYDLEVFKSKFDTEPYGLFYMANEHLDKVHQENRKYVRIID